MDESTARDLLNDERAAALCRVQALASSLTDIVSNTNGANSDDEHDPEGSTLAFERAQVSALLAAAGDYLEELDEALARLSGGTYWDCQRCGGEIAPERLAARPAAVHCIACAGSSRMDP
jgi:RNA polymerase-binding transcription factor DksA